MSITKLPMVEKIFDILLEPTFIIDTNWVIRYCNEAAANLCELSQRRILKAEKKLPQLFTFSESIENFYQLKNIEDSTAYHELSFTTEGGKEGRVQLTIQKFPNEKEPQWLLYFRDVTLEESLQKKYRSELSAKENTIEELKQAQIELQKYSTNLEQMVKDRTVEIYKLNEHMKALLDSLNDGFFIFNSDGLCHDIASKACDETIECNPVDKKIWDVLKLDPKEIAGFKKWMTTVFAEMLPFNDLKELAPKKHKHSEGKSIFLDYHCIRNQENQISDIVVVASDKTDLIEAQNQLATEKNQANLVISVIRFRNQFNSFLLEAEALTNTLNTEAKKDHPDNDELFRILHTLKGGFATFHIEQLSKLTHDCESLLMQWKENPNSETFFELKNGITSLLLSYNNFLISNEEFIGSKEKRSSRTIEVSEKQLQNFSKKYLYHDPKSQLAFSKEFLEVPIKELFMHFNQTIQITAQKDAKKVLPIQFDHSKITVNPQHLQALLNSLVHAFRNSVDHGIETPEERLCKNKPEFGRIDVSFSSTNHNHTEWIEIKITDDGRGIDPNTIRNKLTSKGIDISKKSDDEVIQHVFDSNLSTKETADTHSGRGVGLDAIFHTAKELGGIAQIKSSINQGTTLIVKVPLLKNTLLKSA